jgi:hypothetical protein
MTPLHTSISPAYSFSDLPHNRGCEVKQQNEIVGALVRSSLWSSDHVATTPDGTWTFERTGLLGTGLEIVDSTSGKRIAQFKSHWSGGGTVEFADGDSFHLECKGLWHPAWNVTAANGERVLTLHTREKSVEVRPQCNVTPVRLSILLMLALVCVRQPEEDVALSAMVG